MVNRYFKKTAVLIAFVTLSFGASAQSPFKAAIDLNDYLASFTDTLYQMGSDWGEAFGTYLPEKDFKKLESSRKEVELFAYKKLYELSKFKHQFGSEKLVAAMKSFLEFQAELIATCFIPFERLTAQSSQEQIDAHIQLLTSSADKEKQYLKKINEVQEEFAKRNGFTIEKPDEE